MQTNTKICCSDGTGWRYDLPIDCSVYKYSKIDEYFHMLTNNFMYYWRNLTALINCVGINFLGCSVLQMCIKLLVVRFEE